VASPEVSPAASALAEPVANATGEVTVFAASSLIDAFREVGAAFERANPNVKVTFNFGASSALRTQLEQGARSDVFASADTAQMDAAKRAEAVLAAEHVFARNRLVVIAPRDNPRKVASVKDLAQAGLKLVTTAPAVPIGQYTLDMLDKASVDTSYGSGFRAQVEANIVSREDNVRQVVSKVQLGEADAAVVYATDVTPQVRDQLTQIAVPDPLQTLATYPIAVTRGSNVTGGEAFSSFVLSQPGQDILRKWGFLAP
jgi:molybdate transport system substrate-binding protein